MAQLFQTSQFVIPAKAGIQLLPIEIEVREMAPRLCGGDEVGQ